MCDIEQANRELAAQREAWRKRWANEWEACDDGCPGWLVNAERGNIERCDECGRFEDDDEAAYYVESQAKAATDLLAACEAALPIVEVAGCGGWVPEPEVESAWTGVMVAAMFKLKRERVPGHCAAARCRETSTVVDASGKHWEDEVELCDRHYELRCKIEDVDLIVKTYGVPQELLGDLNSSRALAKANEEVFVKNVLGEGWSRS